MARELGANRIAVVQHGDYVEALNIIRSGQPEPYNGMGYSLRALKSFFGDDEHLVVSLDSSRNAFVDEVAHYVSAARGVGPRILAEYIWGNRALKAVKAFGPNRLLIRTGGSLAVRLLNWSTKNQIDTGVLMACYMRRDHRGELSAVDRQLVDLLNHPSVRFVGNHRRPATKSIVDAGVKPEKAIDYDFSEWPTERLPKNCPVRTLPAPPWTLFYAGALTPHKGVLDVVQAVVEMRRRGRKVKMIIAGVGPEESAIRSAVHEDPEAVQLLGRISNDMVFGWMRNASLVVVPSRHEAPEGLPFTLLEGIASRTPVVASDHPMFVGMLKPFEGVQFFRAGNAVDFSKVAEALLMDSGSYARVSEGAVRGFQMLHCDNLMGDVLGRWRALW